MHIASGNLTDWPVQIRRLRRLKGLKQAALADLISVDQSTISRWENGDVLPDTRMQQRLQALLYDVRVDESLLKHAIGTAIGEAVLSNWDRVIVGASASYSIGHGLSQRDIIGRSARPMYTEESEAIRRLVYDYGFYRGEVASITAIARANTLSGHCHNRLTKAVWTPVRLSDGEILLRSERITLAENHVADAYSQNGGPLRIVRLDDLVR